MKACSAKLNNLSERYEEVDALLSDGDIIGDRDRFRSLSKRHAELEPVVKSYQQYQSVLENIEEAKLLLKDSDEDMREMGQEELRAVEARGDPGDGAAEAAAAQGPNDSKTSFWKFAPAPVVTKRRFFDLSVYPAAMRDPAQGRGNREPGRARRLQGSYRVLSARGVFQA